MIRDKITYMRLVSGLRTKYHPKSRIHPGLISMAPWLSIVLLIFMFILLHSRWVIQPGFEIALPAAPATGGFRSDRMILLRSVERANSRERDERIYFEDEVFRADHPEHMARFSRQMQELARRDPRTGIILYAETRVRAGTLVQCFAIAQAAGIARVNMAVQQPEAGNTPR